MFNFINNDRELRGLKAYQWYVRYVSVFTILVWDLQGSTWIRDGQLVKPAKAMLKEHSSSCCAAVAQARAGSRHDNYRHDILSFKRWVACLLAW